MKKLAIIIVAALLALSQGCLLTPKGYDSDTTPDHNGEHWRGGV